MSEEDYRTFEEQRAFVYKYLSQPYGTKGRFRAEHGVSGHVLYRWRAQVFADTLERGLVPRREAVNVEEVAAMRRLAEENRALREELASRDARHERELTARDNEVARQHQAVEALGKAIELLQPSGGSRSSGPDEPTVATIGEQ